jgi:hypothetical protein
MKILSITLVILALSVAFVQPKEVDLADLLTSIADNWGRQDSEEYVTKFHSFNLSFKRCYSPKPSESILDTHPKRAK